MQHKTLPTSQIIVTKKVRTLSNSPLKNHIEIAEMDELESYPRHSATDEETDPTGIISDYCASPSYQRGEKPYHHPSGPSLNQKRKLAAKLDINAHENLSNIPLDMRQTFLHNSNDTDKKLAHLSPIKIKLELDSLVGPVAKVEHRRNGSLLITTNTLEQLKNIVNCKQLPLSKIPVQPVWKKCLTGLIDESAYLLQVALINMGR